MRENIGRSRSTNKGRSLDEIIRCRISSTIEYIYSVMKHYNKHQSGTNAVHLHMIQKMLGYSLLS